MRDNTYEGTLSPAKSARIHGKFVPNPSNQPQLGKLLVKKADGSTFEVPMNRKDRRASLRAERRSKKGEK